MAAGVQVHVTLVKTIGRSEFTPIAHWISDIAPRDISAGFRRDNPVALNAKSVRPRPLVLLLGIDGEIAFRRWLCRNPNRRGHGHETTITLHYIDILFRE